jgi:hypothetical protein
MDPARKNPYLKSKTFQSSRYAWQFYSGPCGITDKLQMGKNDKFYFFKVRIFEWIGSRHHHSGGRNYISYQGVSAVGGSRLAQSSNIPVASEAPFEQPRFQGKVRLQASSKATFGSAHKGPAPPLFFQDFYSAP